ALGLGAVGVAVGRLFAGVVAVFASGCIDDPIAAVGQGAVRVAVVGLLAVVAVLAGGLVDLAVAAGGFGAVGIAVGGFFAVVAVFTVVDVAVPARFGDASCPAARALTTGSSPSGTATCTGSAGGL